MGAQSEKEDALTYDKLQRMIDKRLAHLEELQDEKERKDELIGRRKNPGHNRLDLLVEYLRKFFSF